MKPLFSKLTVLLIFIATLTACSKEDVLKNPQPVPVPPPPAERASFSFTAVVDLAGKPYHSSNLSAVITVVNDKNEEVLKEKLLSLNLEGSVKTETLQLPVGIYKLTGFRLVYGNTLTHFAAPVAGSSKAAMVQKPLAMSFTVAKTGFTEVAVEVLPVQMDERPALFGYPSGAFDNGQSDADPYMKVKIRSVMQIGEVLYDSIPASLILTTWNDKEEMNTRYVSLAAGINEIPVLKTGVRFRFTVSKWGTNYEMTLDRQNVNEDTVYILGGTKAAKLLKAEVTYKLINGTYVPQSKNEYLYDAAGKLIHINYFLKRADKSVYIAMQDELEYSGSNVQTVRRYNEAGVLTGTTSFSYNNEGKVTRISQNENGEQTTGVVQYFNNTHKEVSIHYTYGSQTYTRDYIMTLNRGNVMKDIAYTSNQTSETGLYEHDLQINPYVHMKWPNLFLSNSSKNNLTKQYKNYQHNYPDAVPYSFSYTYDNEGYPKELVKSFRSYPSNAHLFNTKTVYVY